MTYIFFQDLHWSHNLFYIVVIMYCIHKCTLLSSSTWTVYSITLQMIFPGTYVVTQLFLRVVAVMRGKEPAFT